MRLIAPLFLVVALAACNRPAADPATLPPTSSNPAPAAEEATPFDPECAFCANPAFVRTCEIASGVRTTLHWNADPSLPRVGIFVVDEAGKDSPFAEQPPVGSIETGPWLRPGLTFKLKAPDGTVLQTLVINAKDC